MLGFSVSKILFTIAVLVIVWQVFKRLHKRKNLSKEWSKKVEAKDQVSGDQSQVENMVKCPDCGAYVPEGSNHTCT